MRAVYPVIMCGGSGKRLWPLSRKSYPKQFVAIVDGNSLFQTTLGRFSGAGYADPMLLTNNDFRFIVAEQAHQMGVKNARIIIEPEGRNTAPAIMAAAEIIAQNDPDGIMLVLPSDHVNHDDAAFLDAVKVAVEAAKTGATVTFGVQPTRPETGYGYIELHEKPEDSEPKALPFKRFVEKPDEETAQQMIDSGKFFWNSGTFCFSVKTVLDAFAKFAPEIESVVKTAVAEGQSDLDFFRLSGAYSTAPDISVDYAIMENLDNGMVVPIQTGWNDLGSWRTVWQESHPDGNGVAKSDGAVAIDCENTLLRSDSKDISIVGIGLKNVVAVAMNDAVLVADMDRAQEVKEAVAQLKAQGAKQAEEFPRCYRPWGWYETLSLGGRFQVKRIMVKPGQKLSLQSHVHRSEHWVVVTGSATVTVDDEVKLLSENQSVYIPLGAVHRLENPGKVELHLIEVQSGPYLGEDDIIRYEDIYART